MSDKSPSQNFQRAIAAFDAYHKKDPNVGVHDGKTIASELLYAERMTEMLLRFAPDADEVLQLAARCQHIGRWEIARDQYPKDKKGYLQWRNAEKLHHSRVAEKILLECGYGADVIERVKFLLLKKELFTNPDTQLLEDVACLVFVEFYLEAFAAKHEEEKVIDIVRKTLNKMSARAKELAGIKLPSGLRSRL